MIGRVEWRNSNTYIVKSVACEEYWRRERDSNPRYEYKSYTRFPGVRLQPLGHLSAATHIATTQIAATLARAAAAQTSSYTPHTYPPRIAGEGRPPMRASHVLRHG